MCSAQHFITKACTFNMGSLIIKLGRNTLKFLPKYFLFYSSYMRSEVLTAVNLSIVVFGW
jgi:hypothetical protein